MPWSGQMNLGFIAALVIGILAILGVFIDIPLISEYAFWVLTVPISCSLALAGEEDEA